MELFQLIYMHLCAQRQFNCRVPMNLLFIVKEGREVPRKGYIAKREVMPDPIYNDVIVTKLINNVMLDGKKRYCPKHSLWRL